MLLFTLTAVHSNRLANGKPKIGGGSGGGDGGDSDGDKEQWQKMEHKKEQTKKKIT